jgi:hypothetical protein
MYRRDPRDSWTPAMTHYFHQLPDMSMFDLTPSRLDALVRSTEATVKAAQQAAAPKKR